MKLYVDDIRPAPEGWNQARNVTSAIKAIAMFGIAIIVVVVITLFALSTTEL